MKKLLLSVLLMVGLTSLATAQTPQKIHDLKSLTDSSGTVHLFYRIYAEYEGTEYNSDNIYHYNSETGEKELFLEDYYDARSGFSYSVDISDYKFLDNDPQNYVFITTYCDFECSVTLSRPDSSDIIGGLFFTMDNLNVEGPDSGRVYVAMNAEVIIGENGGRDWPVAGAETFEQIPDSAKLGFPLTSLSPYDDSLMFGIRYTFGADDNGFLRSYDKGNTSEFVSDTLFGNSIQYDVNEETIYLLDTIGAPSSDQNCSIETCEYGLYRSNAKGESGSWYIKNVLPQNTILVAHPTQSGKLYVWNVDSVLVSEDYGETFEVLFNPNEDITGFSVGQAKEYYTTTSTLFSHQNGNSVELLSIPVSIQYKTEVPKQNKLLQNYPNPFNPTTTITYQMEQPGQVTIQLYTITGQMVKELLNTYNSPGTYSFKLNGNNLSSGIYILKGRLGEQMESRTITLIK